ncbi:hypothetical protein GCM10028816_08420 [Spirosoma lituiforme]
MPDNELRNSYKFEFVGGEYHIYAFTTVDEIGYEIKFVPSSYIFEGSVDRRCL